MDIQLKMPDEPGQDLLNFVRGLLILKGSSLKNELEKIQPPVQFQNARAALLGSWEGRRARAVRKDLLAAAGVIVHPEKIPRNKD